MKKFTSAILALGLCMGLLTGCGSSYAAEESTVFVQKDGKIVSTDVEEFDENLYSKEELEEYVNQYISEYTDEYGKKSVKLKDISVADGTAVLSIEYATAEDYTRFNGIELFAGSVAEALAAGYGFTAEFADVSGDQPVPADTSAFVSGEGYKAVIIKGNTNVHVKGTICYVSTINTSLVDKHTVAIGAGNSLYAESVSVEDTQGETVDSTEYTDAMAENTDEGSVGDDELLTGEEESTEIVFDFGDEETADDGQSEYSSIYTYIIYK